MLLAYIMIPLMQRELDIFKDTIWNTHRIRKQKDAILPSGIPNHIYSFPEEYGLEECGKNAKLFLTCDNLMVTYQFRRASVLNP
jgi:hypothetical protein